MSANNDVWALEGPSDRNKVIYYICRKVEAGEVEEEIMIDAYHYIADNKLAPLTILDIKGIVSWATKNRRKK